ncbi:MAG: threonine synthase [Chitinophagaceae bacterium]|nr:threonine synthase [Chitinophagaceae bacterium]
MKYFSTNNKSPLVGFREAAIKGQAPDRGLYFPEHIPRLSKEFIDSIKSKSKEEVAFEVIKPYVGDDIPETDLYRIVSETVNFDFPLVKVNSSIYALELFHGPTLAFKDVGARFMSRCLGYFSKEREGKVTVLVATSGDTGSAVANGFYDVPGVEVVILYPSGKVSGVQEKQLTTLGKNIHSLEVDGTFDDCQKMVKQAFADHELSEKVFLTSANSINVARWLPQQFYYFYAYQQWNEIGAPVISVPSGNFGNLCSGLVAFISGLPVKHFIAACNSNDVVPEFFTSGEYHPKPAKATMSNAMDVGDPSNFVRMIELFGKDLTKMRESITAYSITEEETASTIREVYEKFGYLPDPHGAVGYIALKKYLQGQPGKRGLFLETAHPIKFYDVVEPLTGKKIEMPANLTGLMAKQKVSTKISTYYTEFKNFLLNK